METAAWISTKHDESFQNYQLPNKQNQIQIGGFVSELRPTRPQTDKQTVKHTNPSFRSGVYK